MVRAPADERSSRLFKKSRRYRVELAALGDRVRDLRSAQKLTLEKAAERMSLDLKHLQKVEAGDVNVTFVTLVRIAEGLDVPMGRLFPVRRKAQGKKAG